MTWKDAGWAEDPEELDERMPHTEHRDERLDGKYYVHLFGAPWPKNYLGDWGKKAFHDTMFKSKKPSELTESIIAACEWIRDEEIPCKLVYRIEDAKVGYALEFDNDEDGVNAKLAFFSFF